MSDWDTVMDGYPRFRDNPKRLGFGIGMAYGAGKTVGGLHDYIPPPTEHPTAENVVIYCHTFLDRELVKIDKLDLSVMIDGRWIYPRLRRASFTLHWIKEISKLLDEGFIEQEPAEITLDLLYKILESKV